MRLLGCDRGNFSAPGIFLQHIRVLKYFFGPLSPSWRRRLEEANSFAGPYLRTLWRDGTRSPKRHLQILLQAPELKYIAVNLRAGEVPDAVPLSCAERPFPDLDGRLQTDTI